MEIYVQRNYVTKCAKRMHTKKMAGGVTGVARGRFLAHNENFIGGDSWAAMTNDDVIGLQANNMPMMV